jgi:hypothetical protein
VLDGLRGAQVAQRPFGHRTTLGRGERLGGGQPHRPPVQPGLLKHVVDRRVTDPPPAEPRLDQLSGDRPRALGRVLDGVGDDLVAQRRRHRRRVRPARPRLREQPRLAVALVPVLELIQPRPRTAELAGRLNHRHLATRDTVQHVPAQPCQAVRRSHGQLASVCWQTDRASLSMALLRVAEARRMSGLILVSKP